MSAESSVIYCCLFSLITICIIGYSIKKTKETFENPTTHNIDIKNLKFSLNKIIIKKMDKIKFTNKDIIRHTVICDHDDIPNSGLILPFGIFEIIFKNIGSYKIKSSLYDNLDLICDVEVTSKG